MLKNQVEKNPIMPTRKTGKVFEVDEKTVSRENREKTLGKVGGQSQDASRILKAHQKSTNESKKVKILKKCLNKDAEEKPGPFSESGAF